MRFSSIENWWARAALPTEVNGQEDRLVADLDGSTGTEAGRYRRGRAGRARDF